MSQRLNIEITNGNKVYANAGYRWSGYTSSALCLTQIIVDRFLYGSQCGLKNNKLESAQMVAIKLLEATGAGILDGDLEQIQAADYIPDSIKSYKFKECDDGFLSLTKENIEKTRKFEEGRVTIDIIHKTVNFDCWWFYPNETYKKVFEVEDDEFNKLPILDTDPTEIPFVEFKKFKDKIIHQICQANEDKAPYDIRSDDEMGVYCFIE